MRIAVASFKRKLTPEVLFGCERVVRSAVQRKVLQRGRPTARERLVMVDLQPLDFATPLAPRIDESTALPIALEHSATNGRRHVPPALARQLDRTFVGTFGAARV